LTAPPAVGHAAPADQPPAQQAWCQGRVTLHLRVGVTGHRNIDCEDTALRTAVGKRLGLIESLCPKGTAATPVNLTVVSALAEGADRIVAWTGIARGASLEAVLPLPLDDYLSDFKSDTSRSEFCTLLIDHASAITELPAAAARDEAYERAGRAIVDRSEVLLALWDGQPAHGRGGTAEIVSYAQQQGVPVLQVPVERLDSGSPEPQTIPEPQLPSSFCLLSDSAFKQLDRYNASTLRTGSEPALLPHDLDVPVPPLVQSVVDYAQPYFDRADRVAGSSQARFAWVARLLYFLAAGAVIVVATQIIFFIHDPQIVWLEFLALATVIVAVVAGRRAHWHNRWLTARSLAERIRSGVFLVAVGGSDEVLTADSATQTGGSGRPGPGRKPAKRAVAPLRRWARDGWLAVRKGARVMFPPRGGELQIPDGDVEPDPNQEWVERASREIYWRARRSPAAEDDLPVLKKLLIRAWIDDQARYHFLVYQRLATRQRRLTWLAIALFGVSALVALFHSVGILESPSEPDVWGYLSVVIPAVGGAISGYSAQREYARIAERSRLMVIRLKEAREQVRQSDQLSSLQQAASRTGLLMRSDTAGWYEDVRRHDLEVPSG